MAKIIINLQLKKNEKKRKMKLEIEVSETGNPSFYEAKKRDFLKKMHAAQTGSNSVLVHINRPVQLEFLKWELPHFHFHYPFPKIRENLRSH